MSYLCENEAESIQSGDGYVAQEDAKCKKKLNKAMDSVYPINPKKTLGSRLSILCLLGDQWKALIFPDSPPTDWPTYLRSVLLYIINNGAPVSNSGREN